MYTGVGQQKNSLGMMCLVAGIYYAWKLVKRREGEPLESPDKYDAILVIMAAYLLYISNSQTSLACLLVATALFLATRVPGLSTRPARLIGIAVVAPFLFVTLDSAFGLKDQILALLGRDATLTYRTDLWALVTSHQVNPVIGAGFMSFWTGERMAAIWTVVPGVLQAHSGYIEQYLNLGYIGVGFIVLLMVVALARIRRQMEQAPTAALLRLSLLIVAALYNYTEAAFYGANNMWVLFLVACIELPHPARQGIVAATVPPRAPQSARSWVERPAARVSTQPREIVRESRQFRMGKAAATTTPGSRRRR
jgi:O-antigen ligase